MKKFTSLTFLAVVFLFFITVSSATNKVCSQQYKRNVLGKRTNVEKCPCTLASATFEDKVTGYVIFAQDECGDTTVTGFFSKGLDDPQNRNYTFAIADDCGNIVENLGNLDASFADSGTKPFTKKFDNFNLNCDKSGVLLLKSGTLSKRTYCQKKYSKRAGGGFLNIYNDNEFYSGSSINQI